MWRAHESINAWNCQLKKKSPSPPILSSTAKYSAPACLNPLLQLLLPLPMLSLSLITVTRTPQCPLCWNKRMGFLCCLPTFIVFVLMVDNNLYNVSKDIVAVYGGSACSPPSLHFAPCSSRSLGWKQRKSGWTEGCALQQASLLLSTDCSEQGLGCLSDWKQGS